VAFGFFSSWDFYGDVDGERYSLQLKELNLLLHVNQVSDCFPIVIGILNS
jgi:hypothetical protein